MGSGKSTLGQILANSIGWNFVDLDREIETKLNLKIAGIFKLHGEKYFREIESEVLKEVIKSDDVVVSLGGGTITIPENLNLIKLSGKTIYIKSTPEDLYFRLRHKTNRPLFQGVDNKLLSKEEAIERIKKMISEREKYYSSADLTFSVEKTDVGKAVDLIVKLIYKKFL
ncbi:MAG: shikimate kinase [Ignavibacteria bacterium]|nr:shikimate kinase [Ignavibacteria bacterium]